MYKRVKKNWWKHIDFMLLDLLCMEVVLVLCYVLRMGRTLSFSDRTYSSLGIILVLLDIGTVFFTDAYSGILRRGALKELKSVVGQVTLVYAWIFAYLFIMHIGGLYSRQILLTSYVFSILTCFIARYCFKAYLKKYYQNMDNTRNVMVITTSARVDSLITKLTPDIIRDFKITALAVMDKDMVGCQVGNVKVTANETSLLQYACSEVLDEVILAMPEHKEAEHRLAEHFLDMGITVHIDIEEAYNRLPNCVFEKTMGIGVLTASVNMASPSQMFLKRAMDICGALVGLLITFIAGIIAAPVIWIQSPGPVIFSQIRVGKGGRKFRIYKFRSMYMDAEKRKQELMKKNKMQGLMFKLDDDPRIIKGIGHFIRKTSIDELPQFWNVLKGDMSLVGTRPPTVDEYEQYELHHKRRLSIKPGITGMWQVSGRSDITDFEEVVQLDSDYIYHWSLGMDIKILFRTVHMVLKRRGAE